MLTLLADETMYDPGAYTSTPVPLFENAATFSLPSGASAESIAPTICA